MEQPVAMEQPVVVEQPVAIEPIPFSASMECNTENQPVNSKPNQPRNINFPARQIGSKVRRFRVAWYDQYSWLEWNNSKHAAFCHTCMMACQLKLMTFSHNVEDAFTRTGFTNWKHALEKFTAHERSSAHKEATLKWSNYIRQRNIAPDLSTQISDEQMIRREALLWLFSSLKYLSRQGLATRGHTDANSNYHQLLYHRAEDSPALRHLLQTENNRKYLSHDIETEMLECMSHSVLRQPASDIRNHGYFAVIVDESREISCTEQVSICIRHVDNNFSIYEDFIGLYSTNKTDAGTLTSLRMRYFVSVFRWQTSGPNAMTERAIWLANIKVYNDE